MKEANEIEFKPLRRQIVPKGTQGSCRGSLLRSAGSPGPTGQAPATGWLQVQRGPPHSTLLTARRSGMNSRNRKGPRIGQEQVGARSPWVNRGPVPSWQGKRWIYMLNEKATLRESQK